MLCISVVMVVTQVCKLVQKNRKKKCTLEIDTNYHIYTNYTSIKVDLDTIIHAGYNAESLVPTSVFEVVVGGGVQVSVLPIHGAQGNKWAGAPDGGDSDRKEAQGPGVSGCGDRRDSEGPRALRATGASSDSSQRGRGAPGLGRSGVTPCRGRFPGWVRGLG